LVAAEKNGKRWLKWPLAGVISSYAAGLLLGSLSQPPLAILFATTFVTLAAVLASSRLRRYFLWPLLALTGWTNFTLHTAVVSPVDLRQIVDIRPAVANAVSVRGTLAETPHLKIQDRNGEEIQHSLAQVTVMAIRQGGAWQPACGNLIVTTPGTLGSSYFGGQSVEITGSLARPQPPLAEGLFDYRDYLATRGIFFELKARSTNDWTLPESHLLSPPLTDRFLDWSRSKLALGLPNEDESLRLLWAMTLGWRTAFSGDISEPFLRAGTMHMFAIDGLRIALLSGMIVTLLRTARLSRAWSGAVAVPLIWFYTAATGWESSAVRASVMMTIILGGWALKRPSDTINSLAAAALIILLWDPRQLFEASFQLSFFVVLTLSLMLPPLNRWFDRILQPDPLLPVSLIPRWRLALIQVLRMFARYCALSFAAWIGSIPLSIKYFHLFSPISTLANLLAVPLGTLALMSNLGALACGTWFPFATELFNQAAWFFMNAMTWVSEAATKIPGAYYYVPDISWLTIGVYYLAIIAICSGWILSPLGKRLGTAAGILLGAFYLWQWHVERHETDITILPLNGGHAIYVDAAGRYNDWLIDCGNEKTVDTTLKPFLRGQGVNSIPRLALTEGEARNCGGADSLDQLFGIHELWTSTAKSRSKPYRDTIMAFEKPPDRHKVFNYGDIVGPWQVLNPDTHPADEPTETGRHNRADDNALVLLGRLQGAKILLLSDLSPAGQTALLARTNDLHADVVVTGLPTEGEPLNDSLIDAIQPKVIVVIDSEYPVQQRASRALMERLGRSGIPVVYTRTAGAVTIVTNPHGWKLHTMDGQEFKATR
jgi:ComEC/Rec2-related protein